MNVSAFLYTLPYIVKGMVGIFLVTGVIVLTINLLSRYAGKVLTYDMLMARLWGPKARGNNRLLRVNMANIRRKLEKDPASPRYILTEARVGYRMAEPEEL